VELVFELRVSCLQSRKAGTLLLKPHLQSISALGYFGDGVS
jgi:hypothetical protein